MIPGSFAILNQIVERLESRIAPEHAHLLVSCSAAGQREDLFIHAMDPEFLGKQVSHPRRHGVGLRIFYADVENRQLPEISTLRIQDYRMDAGCDQWVTQFGSSARVDIRPESPDLEDIDIIINYIAGCLKVKVKKVFVEEPVGRIKAMEGYA